MQRAAGADPDEPPRAERRSAPRTTIAALGPPMPVDWTVSGSPSRAEPGVAPQPAGVVEHAAAPRAAPARPPARGAGRRAAGRARRARPRAAGGWAAPRGRTIAWAGGAHGQAAHHTRRHPGRPAGRGRADGAGHPRLGQGDARRARRGRSTTWSDTLGRSRSAVLGALEERRPATQEDVKELKAELRKIGRRLDAIEERLPKRRASAKR